MKEIKFVSNFGRFAYEATASIGEEVNEQSTALCIRGLADTCFRGVSSDVEKALVKAGKMGETTKRSEVLFSTESAALITTTAQAKLDEIAKKGNLPAMSFRVTGEHVFGESGDKPTKEATEFWTKVQQIADPAKFETTLKTIGIPEDYDDDSAILACKRYIQDARKKAMEKAAADAGLPI